MRKSSAMIELRKRTSDSSNILTGGTIFQVPVFRVHRMVETLVLSAMIDSHHKAIIMIYLFKIMTATLFNINIVSQQIKIPLKWILVCTHTHTQHMYNIHIHYIYTYTRHLILF